jgi:hypothetical protein
MNNNHVKTAMCQAFSKAKLRIFISFLIAVTVWVLGQPAQAASTPDVQHATSESIVFTAKKATTLDGIIKVVYPDSPLNTAILSKALHAANPKLLNGKASQSIKRGATLNIPDHTQLVMEKFAPYIPKPKGLDPSASSEQTQDGSQSSDPSSRRFWVRFP